MAEVMHKLIPVLETVLKQSADRHEQMFSLMQRQREALRQADHRAVTEYSRLENAMVQAIGDLEKRRQELVAQMTRALDPGAAAPMRMRDLAQRLPEPARGRLLVLRGQLRERVDHRVGALARLRRQLAGRVVRDLAGRKRAEMPPDERHGLVGVEVAGDAEHGVVRRVVGVPELLDRFERRGGEWRIAERTAVTEWSRVDDAAGRFTPGEGLQMGQRDRSDASYALFEGLLRPRE